MVCGSVTVSPWLETNDPQGPTGSPSNVPSATFAVPNCGGGETPDLRLSSAASQFSQAVDSAILVDCNGIYSDACSVAQTAYSCLAGALQIAASTLPFPVPGSSPTDQAETFAGNVVSGLDSYVQAGESADTTFGHLVDFESGLLGAIGSIIAMATAYQQCAP